MSILRRISSIRDRVSSLERKRKAEPMSLEVWSVIDGVDTLLDAWGASGEHIYHLDIDEQLEIIKDEQ